MGALGARASRLHRENVETPGTPALPGQQRSRIMKNILIDIAVHPEKMARLKSLPGVSVESVEPKEEVRDLPRSQIESVHFLFCTFPPRNLEDMCSLELIQIASAGYSQLIHLGLDRKSIRACNGLGNFDVPIAE